MTVCSYESRPTNTTKTFTGESSLTGSIVQTWAATTRILLREKQNRKQNKTKQNKKKKNRRLKCT